MTPPMLPPGWICNRKVGYLFPRVCGRTTPAACPHCRDGQTLGDPYDEEDRGTFLDWGDYDGWQFSSSSGSMDAVDFNESDAETLTDSAAGADADFENDAGGS